MRTFVMLLALLLPGPLLAQQLAPKTCKDVPGQCDKEILLLREEVDTKRRLLAAVWAMQDEWQQRAEQAEAKLKALEAVPAPAPPEAAKD